MSSSVSEPKNTVENIAKTIFGDEAYEEIAKWSIKREKPDKYYAVPKGRVANVFVVLEVHSRALIKHEQDPYDATIVPVTLGHEVPAILNTKFQSGSIRRQLLTILRDWFERNRDTAKKELGMETYTCVMRPYLKKQEKKQERSQNQSPEEFEGYCTACPNCLIFGYAVQEGGNYNVKSRVEGDIYFGLVDMNT